MDEVSELLNSESSLAGLPEDSGYLSIRKNPPQKQNAVGSSVNKRQPLAFNRPICFPNGMRIGSLTVDAGVLFLSTIVHANHNDKPT